MISFCVTVKNRSRVIVDDLELRLFPGCVRSIAQAVAEVLPDPGQSELVVADWNSDDWPLEEWIHTVAGPVPVRVLQLEGDFNRGRGRNAAGRAAGGDVLFFVDADSLISPELLRRGLEHLREGKAYFPVLYSFDDPGHTTGYWRHAGYGNCMLRRATFEQADGWPEHDRWGKEDTEFHTLIEAHAAIVREEVAGFYHQWHPDDMAWKDRLTPHGPGLEEEARRLRAVAQHLGEFIPEGERFILVDEDRLGAAVPVHRKAIPFTEKEGRYWGPPADDAAAIEEFERLLRQGAAFIGFAWMAFWWLDFYRELDRRLRSGFPCLVDNENLVLFDLRGDRSREGDAG